MTSNRLFIQAVTACYDPLHLRVGLVPEQATVFLRIEGFQEGLRKDIVAAL